MEILSGRFKGKRIKTVARAAYRPTIARVRKSIFDIIGNLEDCVVLDLFAGSGILGFEALSRGANHLTLVENNYDSVRLLKQNSNLFTGVNIQIIRKSVFSFLPAETVYDLILADPPYGKVDLNRLVDLVMPQLAENGIFILETGIRAQLAAGYQRQKIYGDTRISFWEKKT